MCWGPGCRCLAARPAEQGVQRCLGRQQTWRWSCRRQRDGVVGDTETALFVRLMEPHVNPSTVLGPRLVCLPGPLFEEGVGDLPIDMLLLEAVLIRKGNLAVEVLKAGSLAKSKELVVDEAILDVVELVDVIHNCLTLILDKMLDKSISADGNPKAARRSGIQVFRCVQHRSPQQIILVFAVD